MENEPQDAYLPGSEDPLQPFDVRAQTARGGMLKLVGLIGFLLVLAFIISKLFASGTREREQIPRILADNSPYKEVPLERGGAQTPNQDKEIYQVLNGSNTETAVTTVPVAEDPLPKPVPIPDFVPPKITSETSTKPAANVVIKDSETAKAAQQKPVIVTPQPRSGNYVVQVAALRSRSEAETMWNKLTSKMSGTLSAKHFSDIKRVDLGSRGIYYRLRISGLANKTAANQLCQKLKAKKQDCIVTLK
jgi:cell division protein FtsN